MYEENLLHTSHVSQVDMLFLLLECQHGMGSSSNHVVRNKMKDMASNVNSFVPQTHTKGASLDHDVTIVNLSIFILSLQLSLVNGILE